MIEFNAKARETIPKEGAIESHTFLHEVLAYIYWYWLIDDWYVNYFNVLILCHVTKGEK